MSPIAFKHGIRARTLQFGPVREAADVATTLAFSRNQQEIGTFTNLALGAAFEVPAERMDRSGEDEPCFDPLLRRYAGVMNSAEFGAVSSADAPQILCLSLDSSLRKRVDKGRR
jgi:hypothetical protein